MTTEDPWAGARTAARDDVKAALARGARHCPACGHEQDSSGRFCDACGADLTARYRKPRKYRTAAVVVLGLLLLAAAAYPLVQLLRDDAAIERERTAERQAALEAAEIERLEALVAQARALRLRPARAARSE
jgi:predicted nucleic acid-binding Zn ribbon protein